MTLRPEPSLFMPAHCCNDAAPLTRQGADRNKIGHPEKLLRDDQYVT